MTCYFYENVFPYASHKEMTLQKNLEVTTFLDSNAWKKKELDCTIQKGNTQQSKATEEIYAQIQKGDLALFVMKIMSSTLKKKMMWQLN